VTRITIEGNKTIPEEAILRYIETRPGRPASPRLIQQDVAKLHQTRWFLSVRPFYRQIEGAPDGEDIELVFEVLERPILQEVTFKGNKKIKTGELQAHTGLRTGHAFDVTANRESVQRIKALYRERGHRFAEVTLEKGGSPDDREVVFLIEEGPKVRVRGVKFDGNKFVSGPVLKTKLSTKSALVGLFGGEYDPDSIRNDVLALKQYYMSLGFFDVEIDSDVRFSEDKGKVTVVFQIEEGRRYQVGSIEVVGNEVIPREQLMHKLKLKPGDDFNARFLREDVTSMKDQYDDIGRLFAKVDPVPHFREDDSGMVDLTYRVDEDIPRYIGQIRIHIRGDHPHTQEEVVRQQVHRFLKPGMLARGADLRMAQARVRGSHIWDPADPPTFDVQPVDGMEYVPHLTSRGQSGEQEASVDVTVAGRPFHPPELGTDSLIAAAGSPSTDRASRPDPLEPGHSFGTHGTSVPKPKPANGIGGNRVPHTPSPSLRDPDEVFGGHDDSFSQRLPNRGQFQNDEQRAPDASASPQAGRAQVPSPESRSGFVTIPDRDASAVATPAPARSNPAEGGRGRAVPGDSPDPGSAATAATPGRKPFTDPDVIFRGQSPSGLPQIHRGQSYDEFGQPVPQDYLQNVSPQGDPFGDALSRPPVPGFVDVSIDVTEGRTGRLMFGVGVNSDAGVIGSLVLQEDNFDILRPPRSWSDILNGQAWRGAGQSFRIEAVPGIEVSRYMVSWQDPFFMRSDFSLGVSGFFYNRWFHDWTEDRLGGRVSLGYVLDRFWSVTGAVRMEDVRMRRFRLPAPDSVLDVAGSSFLSTAAVTFSYDSRDNAFVPTMGNFADFTYEQGFGEFSFPKFDVTAGQHLTVYERPDGYGKHIVSLTGQLGWTGSNTPVYERFFAGGFSSFRGFDFRGVGPRDQGFRVGGEWLMLGSAEYMFPLTADDNIRGVVFSDFGTVEETVRLDDFRVTAGFGLRMVIPMMGPAPLAFDFAWPLRKTEFDDTRVFSFYVGFTR
jgi:outer membrane protein insertion porin family